MNDNNNENKASEWKMWIGIIAFFLIIFLLFGKNGLLIGNSSSSSNGIPDTYRCYYCSKVIRSGGRNIHCTVISQSSNKMMVKCDYCGHKTVIK